jgi:NitT/TauT family transport system permease protein
MSTDTIVRPSPAKPVGRKSSVLNDQLVLWGTRIGLLVVLIGFWQLSSGGRGSLLPNYAFGTPHTVGSAFADLVPHAELYDSIGSTLAVVIYGTLISAPIGIALALVTASPVGRWLLEPIITICYAIPKVGLISIYVLLLGVTEKTHIVLVVSGLLFVYFFAMRQAIEDIDRRQVIDFRLLGAGWPKIASALFIRAALPNMIGATRLALPLGFAIEIFAELRITTSSGMGALLQREQLQLNTPASVAVMLLVLVIGYFMDILLGYVLRRYAQATGSGSAL